MLLTNRRIIAVSMAAFVALFMMSCSKKEDSNDNVVKETTAVTEEVSPADTLSNMNIYGDDLIVLDNLNDIKEIGQLVSFGSYEQANNGDPVEPIEWIVMDIKDNKALLLSRYVIDSQPYNTQKANISWDSSTIRAWLNSDFIATAFSEMEKGKIMIMPVDNTNDGGQNTTDSVFLLSVKEAESYFRTNSSLLAKATAFADARGVYALNNFSGEQESYNGNCRWWLRTIDNSMEGLAMYVRAIGDVFGKGQDVTNTDIGVRPAMWVSIK